MSIVFNGQGSLVTPTVGPSARGAIVSSTNAAPIVVTQTAHGYNTGDTVEVESHLVNTAANGLWQIVKVDANRYSLDGSTGVGAGTATGYVTDYELQPAIVVPTGGELVDPGVIGAAIEGVDNLGPYLYRACGKYRLHDVYRGIGLHNFPGTAWATSTVTNSWAVMTGCSSMLPLAPTPSLHNGDILRLTLVTSMQAYQCSNQSDLVAISFVLLGSIPFARAQFFVQSDAWGGSGAGPYNGKLIPVSLTDTFVVSGVTSAPSYLSDVQIWGIGTQASGDSIALYGCWELIVEHYRLNSP